MSGGRSATTPTPPQVGTLEIRIIVSVEFLCISHIEVIFSQESLSDFIQLLCAYIIVLTSS